MGKIQDGSAVFTVRDKREQAFFDFVYPVGIVVALANDKKPAFMNYGTWEKVAENRVLQGASDSNAPGKKIEPGLPNITGSTLFGGIFIYQNYSPSGAFYKKSENGPSDILLEQVKIVNLNCILMLLNLMRFMVNRRPYSLRHMS